MKVICIKAKNKTCPKPCDAHGVPHERRIVRYDGTYCTAWGNCIQDDGESIKTRCTKVGVKDEG